jgi:hypothetical protein
MAKLASVTVSIAAESMGTFNVMSLVSFVLISTSRGSTWLYAGINKTSSNVSPSPKNFVGFVFVEEVDIVAMCEDRKIQNAKFKSETRIF